MTDKHRQLDELGSAGFVHLVRLRKEIKTLEAKRRLEELLEKYDVETIKPGGGGEYPLQDGFGWTNGVTRALLDLYPGVIADGAPATRPCPSMG